MAVGKRLVGLKQVIWGNQRLIAEKATESFDFLRGPVGEVGQGAFLDFSAFAMAFAEKHRGWGVAVGNTFDVHGPYIT